MFDLTGRHILITGGLGLLGASIREALQAQGADVTVLDLTSSGPRSIACDLASVDEIRDTATTVEARWGPVDVLINNAATRGSRGRYFDLPDDYEPETWHEVMSVNLDGVFWMSQAIGTRMATRGFGSIINTASIYSSEMGVDHRIYPIPDESTPRMNSPVAYSAAKAGVVGLTKYLAAYWAPANVRVNAVAPGGIEAGQPESFRLAYADRVPMARMGRPSDVVGAYAFLASDAAGYITGQCIYVDGGLSSW
ncbi:MAG: SDR family oxidoreductase [Actinomycetota bacterium]|nr:SDR family oxidoreductase [Actinomycetota bacterium]